MGGLTRLLAAVLALGMSAGSALATMGKTTTDIELRRGPTAQAELILNLSKGTLVDVGSCSRGWCGVTWNRYGGYVRQSALQLLSTPASGPPGIPVFPPYPYKAGHYPTADAYYDLPPYAAIDPSFYHWRHFLTAQERNRYRYMPHIFHRVPSGYLESVTISSAETTVPAGGPHPPKSPPQTEPQPAAPTPKPPTEGPPPAPPPTPPRPTTPTPSSTGDTTANRYSSAGGITPNRCTSTEPSSAGGITPNRCTSTEPSSAGGVTALRCAWTGHRSARTTTRRHC